MLLATASAVKPAIWASHWGQLALMSSESISIRSNIVSCGGQELTAKRAKPLHQARMQAKDFNCSVHACLTFWKIPCFNPVAQVKTWRLREVKKLTQGHTVASRNLGSQCPTTDLWSKLDLWEEQIQFVLPAPLQSGTAFPQAE